MRKSDAVIIGFGKGGKTLAGALAAAGKQVIMVEQSEKMYGGTCINVACIPSKSLVHNSALSHVQGGSFEEKARRYTAAIEKKDQLTDKLRSKNYHKLADNPNITVLTGKASFMDDHHVKVETPNGIEELQADRIFINTGARPFVPPIEGLQNSKHVYVSETLLDLKQLPQKMILIGGGYIALEMASIYTNFGSQVTILQDAEEFLPREDSEVAQSVLESLEKRGIRVMRSVKVQRVEDSTNQVIVTVQTKAGEEKLQGDAVLVATGRRPNVQDLHLEAAGVALTERGAVQVNEHLQTTAQNIWAMGDVVGGLQFTYISLDDFRIVKSHLLGDGSRTTENRGAIPYSVFIDPPLSRVGYTEQEALQNGFEIKAAKLPAAAIPKANVLQNPTGLLKVVIDAKTDLILGAHIFCEESFEMINIIKLAMDAKIPYTVLRDNIYTHPTMSESFNDLFASV